MDGLFHGWILTEVVVVLSQHMNDPSHSASAFDEPDSVSASTFHLSYIKLIHKKRLNMF